MQQIAKDEPTKPFNYIKYDNFFVTNVISSGLSKACYCILMDQCGNTITIILNKLKIKNMMIKIVAIIDILQQTKQNMLLLKNPKYLFTNTDMKWKNLFYKKSSISNDIILFLVDFYKSSISYHNIRFYNDITKNPNIIPNIISKKNSIYYLLYLFLQV